MIWVETNDGSCKAYSTNSQIELEISILESSLCDYCDAYIPCKENITVPNTKAADAASNNFNKKQIFKIVFHLLNG